MIIESLRVESMNRTPKPCPGAFQQQPQQSGAAACAKAKQKWNANAKPSFSMSN